MKKVVNALIVSFLILSVFPLVSAGVGLSWSQESALIPQNANACLTYGVYNPWPKGSYVEVNLSDSLQSIIASSDASVSYIPPNTSSNNSIPVKFCFNTPQVYPEHCLLFNTFLCSQNCSLPMKTYTGQVEVKEVSSSQLNGGGSGGSATQMSISAPLTVRVQCVKHGTDYSIIYIIIGIIALAILLWRLLKRKKGTVAVPGTAPVVPAKTEHAASPAAPVEDKSKVKAVSTSQKSSGTPVTPSSIPQKPVAAASSSVQTAKPTVAKEEKPAPKKVAKKSSPKKSKTKGKKKSAKK